MSASANTYFARVDSKQALHIQFQVRCIEDQTFHLFNSVQLLSITQESQWRQEANVTLRSAPMLTSQDFPVDQPHRSDRVQSA